MKVILLLGPYRNLTTMTAAYLNFHPDIVTFNHGIGRLTKAGGNFWELLTEESFEIFQSYVLDNYQGGRRGPVGGSILKTHAFDSKNPVASQKALIPSKDAPKYILLKESGKVTPFVKKNLKTLQTMFRDRLYFIRPVRNICKAVKSGTETRLGWRMVPYLTDLSWFHEQRNRDPERWIYFWEKDLEKFFHILLPFLGLETTDTCDAVIKDVAITDSRVIDTSMRAHKKETCAKLLKDGTLPLELFKEIEMNDDY